MAYIFRELREKYLTKDIGVYLNTPANGLMRKDFEDRLRLDLEPYLLKGSVGMEYFIFDLFPRVKKELASFIEGEAENIALMPNYSFAHQSVTSALPDGTKIAIIEDDYPSLTTPFLRGKFEVYTVSIQSDGLDYEALENLLKKEGIDILAFSHAQYLSGYVADMGRISEMCRDLNVLTMVDVTQSIGAIGINIAKHNWDVVAASCYKWMNAGYASGFMHLSERFMEKYPAVIGGFTSYVVKPEGKEFVLGINNYEPGNLNPANYQRLLYNIEEKRASGVKTIGEHNRGLVNYVRTELKKNDRKLPHNFPSEKLHSFMALEGSEQLRLHLAQNNVHVAFRGKHLRIGFHFYNNQEDADRFLELYLGS